MVSGVAKTVNGDSPERIFFFFLHLGKYYDLERKFRAEYGGSLECHIPNLHIYGSAPPPPGDIHVPSAEHERLSIQDISSFPGGLDAPQYEEVFLRSCFLCLHRCLDPECTLLLAWDRWRKKITRVIYYCKCCTRFHVSVEWKSWYLEVLFLFLCEVLIDYVLEIHNQSCCIFSWPPCIAYTKLTSRMTKRKIILRASGGTFKDRYRNHVKSTKHDKYKNETQLSKYIWNLKKTKE